MNCQLMRCCFVVGALVSACVPGGRAAAQPCGEGQWTLAVGEAPDARYANGIAYDSIRNRTVVFGGEGSSGASRNDTWEWSGTAWQPPAPLGFGPSTRVRPAMAFHVVRGTAVLYGGYSAESNITRSDTWEWNGSSWTQWSGASPGPRRAHAVAYDTARDRLVLFGGHSGSGLTNDTWEWDGVAWMQRASAGPAPRQVHAMAYDSGRGKTVLFGGAIQGGEAADTWEWDGATWTDRTPGTGPSPRGYISICYDAGRARTVLYGGYDHTTTFGDTWEWDGTAWTLAALACDRGASRSIHRVGGP